MSDVEATWANLANLVGGFGTGPEIMAAARRCAQARALEVLDEIHAAVCHPSALEIAHGAEDWVHRIADHTGIDDKWVATRKRMKEDKAND